MKKKIFSGIALLAIAAVAAVNVSVGFNSQNEELTSIEFANVNALATSEGSNKNYDCPSGKNGCVIIKISSTSMIKYYKE